LKEYQLQKAIVAYIKLQYPNVLYCASAGGLRTSMTQAVKMRASGYIKGYPDLSILEPIGKFHSLFLEVKTKKGRATKEQLWWREKLNERNFIAEIVYGYDEAVAVIDRYLNNKIK
tara:strand:+ start:684 stop:1031 length:348 start_codon:yes stop_codon:yes gene_type:complete